MEDELSIGEITVMDVQEGSVEVGDDPKEGAENTGHSKSKSVVDLDSDENNEDYQERAATTTSNQVLRPRTKRIDYTMYHKYEDAQLLQVEQEVVTKMYDANTRDKNKLAAPRSGIKKHKKLKIKKNDMFRKVLGMVMTQIARESKHAQVSVKEGIKRYGERAVQTVFNEYAQLDEKIYLYLKTQVS